MSISTEIDLLITNMIIFSQLDNILLLDNNKGRNSLVADPCCFGSSSFSSTFIHNCFLLIQNKLKVFMRASASGMCCLFGEMSTISS